MQIKEKLITEFQGYSGCKILLYLSNDKYFVRKISKNIEYNARLEKQLIKQRFFMNKLAKNNLQTPKILGEGYINNLFYFDMEYVPGKNLITYIPEATVEELEYISKTLLEIIGLFKSLEKENNALIKDKSINKTREINAKITHLPEFKEMIDEIERGFYESDTAELKETFCHGDLTIENIIYDPNKKIFYLIDFLDTYSDHYWFDISKLFQDIEASWYSIRYKDINLNNMYLKMAYIENYLNKNLILKEQNYRRYHYLFLSLTLARILPYAKDSHLNFLKSKIKYFLEKHLEVLK